MVGIFRIFIYNKPKQSNLCTAVTTSYTTERKSIVVLTCLLIYLLAYLFTYLLHGAESFLRSQPVLSQLRFSPYFMEPEGSLPHSQVPSTCPYPEQKLGRTKRSGQFRWRSCLRHCATSRKVAGSIPDGVIEIFH